MGIYIKGMEMPKDGTVNIIHIYSDGRVSLPYWGKGMQVTKGIEAIPVAAVITWAELKGLMVDKFKSRLAAGYTPTWNDAMEVVEELRPNGGQDE